MSAIDSYRRSLNDLPAPGGGCHAALLGVSNLGAIAGLAPHEIFSDLRSRIDGLGGSRKVSDREIRDAVNKAIWETPRSSGNTSNGFIKTYAQSKPKPTFDPKATLEKLLSSGNPYRLSARDLEYEIWERSPIRIEREPGKVDLKAVLMTLYHPEDLIFIGGNLDAGRVGENIRTVSEWLAYLNKKDAQTPGEFFIPNSLTGRQETTKDGKPTFRGDACVKSFKYAVVEYDSKPDCFWTKEEEDHFQKTKEKPVMPYEWQLSFWHAVNLPVAALIFSASKSIHGWIECNCIDRTEWESKIENRLFKEFLEPLKIDGANKNEARLSRTPGHFRQDKGKFQKLLYLAPGGRRVTV